MADVRHKTVFDTEQQQVGVIYAKALLSFGTDAGILDTLVEQLSDVVNVVGEVDGLQALLESPRISFDEKSKVLDKAFTGRVEQSLINFLKIVGS
jgi:F-type H+-transporting ATPase subunit delta